MTEPKIYTPDDHGLKQEQIDPDAQKVVRRLREKGHEAYIVGGAVRDLLLRRQPKDFDIATDATPAEIKSHFGNSRIIGRRFQIAHVYFKGKKVIEVSTFRRIPDADDPDEVEVEQADNQWGTAEDDARRRDLTINAFFLDPDAMAVYDYLDGMTDLREGRVRIIGDPELRFREDPVRMIRAIRHAARTGFLIDEHDWETLCSLTSLIRECNESRLRQEFIREFQEGAAARSLKLLHRSGLLAELLPQLAEFLDGLVSRPEEKRTYWKLIDLMDNEGALHDLPNSLVLATAVGPAIAPELLTIIPKKTKLRIEKISQAFEPYAKAVGLQRGLVEPLAQTIFAQPKLDRARQAGNLPKRLKSKSYFPLAMHLCLMRHKAIGSWIPDAWEEKPPELPSDDKGGGNKSGKGKSKRKRRRRRRSRKGGRGKGKGKGNNGGKGD